MAAAKPVHFPEFFSGLPSMDGKTVVITGATSGTGQVAASTVAALGAKVLVLNRTSERSRASFVALSGSFPEADLHDIECDLQSFSSVKVASERVAALCPEGVHVLCNNAGVMAFPDRATPDGFDVQMQTNHLSHFLLSKELMPLLERAAESDGDARIVQHSSTARLAPSKILQAEFLEKKGGDLGGDGSRFQNMSFRGPRWLRYNQTKLANAAFTAALHHQLQEKGSLVKALVAHPGLATTQLQQTTVKEGGMGGLFTGFFMRLGQTPEDGAMGILSCMCLPEARSGQFYGPGSGVMAPKGKAVPFDLESFYDNPDTRELLWKKSEEAIGMKFTI